MRRLLQVIVLYAVLAQATGLVWASTEDTCASDCRDDGDHRQCPPNCADCVCSVHAPATFAMAPVVVVKPLPPPRALTFPSPRDAAASPDPRDILHVPRAQLV